MSTLSYLTDIGQAEQLDLLTRRVKKLERKLNGGNQMSKMISELTGRDCLPKCDNIVDVKCRILEVDDEWLKIVEYGKKEDKTRIIRIDTVTSFELN